METFAHDLRFALRMLVRNLGATMVGVLTLALGIGACTAIFTVVNGVLLRPLPYPQPKQLVQLWEVSEEGNRVGVPEANLVDWRQSSQAYEGMAAFNSRVSPVLGGSQAARARVSLVSAGFFDVLGVHARIGHSFLPEEHQRDAQLVAAVSHSFWQQQLGGDPALEGRTLTVLGRPCTVVGVMPPGFSFPPGAEVWIPLESMRPFNPSRSSHNYRVIARLKPSLTPGQAGKEISALAKQIRQQYTDVTAVDAIVVPLHEQMTGRVRLALLVLVGAVALLLLVACANVTNLLLAEATARRRELAIRSALGAGRWRLVRLFLSESLLLALLGGALGVAVAAGGVRALLSLGAGRLPRVDEIQVDGWVLGFALGLSILTALVLGVIPALRASRSNLQEILKEGGRSQAGGRSHQRVRSLLLVSQVALTLVLVTGTGLLTRSLWRLLQVDLGFQTENRLSLKVFLQVPRNSEQLQQLADFHRRLQQEIAAMPGVIAAGGVTNLPLGGGGGNGRFQIEGAGDSGDYWPDYRVASPGYFRAMGIPLLRGRPFDDSDGPNTPHVAVISESVARRVWPDQEPLGKRINWSNMDGYDDWITIVGIVGDVRHRGPESPTSGAIYLHYLQRSRSTFVFTAVIHAAGDPNRLVPALRKQVQALDPQVPTRFRTLEQLYSSVLADRHFTLTLLAIFAGVALLLAALGIYGVMAYSVAQRTHEIGIRMAIGAHPSHILWLVVGQSLRVALVGVAVGLAGALALTRFLRSFLVGVTATDPLTFAAVPLVLLGAALLACYVPARRATAVNPMIALRYE